MLFRFLLLWCLMLCIQTRLFSQDYFSYGNSNFGGINQVISNPAAAADNRLKFDLVLAGIDFNFNNSWFGVKREALKRTNSQLPLSWKNTTPNVPDNIFKNFQFYKSTKSRALIIENRIILPSFLVQINSKNSIAFSWSVRQFANVSNLSPKLSYLFEKEMDLNASQNNNVKNKNFSGVQMAWAEYGLTYAHVLSDKGEHFLKGGGTVKILQGLESAYLVVNNLDFLFSTKDTTSYFNTNFSYAHSANLGASSFDSKKPLGSIYHYVTKPALGLDLGFIYEWRPNHLEYKIKTDKKHFGYRHDVNKYRLKLAASIVDIGRIKYEKRGTTYDLNVALTRNNLTPYTDLKNTSGFDSLARINFSTSNPKKQFSILLPTAINTQVDLSLNQFFYLNLSAHISNLYKNNLYNIHNYSAICFAPRFEHYWFDLSVPFTYNTLSAKRYEEIMMGLNVKVGPLTLGTQDLMPLIKKNAISALNFYAIVKLSIPYHHDKDKDKDGVKDKKDACPDVAGEKIYNGCPDSDHDKIPDKDDACPHQAGTAEFKGCPDSDHDGVKDSEDECPQIKGSKYFHGCPDTDRDSIVDIKDSCPTVYGPNKFHGCPDRDHDNIIDKLDACPGAFGLAKHHGCPDRDHDNIIDKDDACPTVAGVPEYKGCPPPAPATPVDMAPKEKRILEKAYSSLEFATGRDIIKESSFPSLHALAKMLSDHESEWKIKLSGHTDSEGSAQINLLLSEKRAKAVQKYLIKSGLAKESIIVEWFGETKHIADNKTKAGQQKNRRVEMTLLMNED